MTFAFAMEQTELRKAAVGASGQGASLSEGQVLGSFGSYRRSRKSLGVAVRPSSFSSRLASGVLQEQERDPKGAGGEGSTDGEAESRTPPAKGEDAWGSSDDDDDNNGDGENQPGRQEKELVVVDACRECSTASPGLLEPNAAAAVAAAALRVLPSLPRLEEQLHDHDESSSSSDEESYWGPV